MNAIGGGEASISCRTWTSAKADGNEASECGPPEKVEPNHVCLTRAGRYGWKKLETSRSVPVERLPQARRPESAEVNCAQDRRGPHAAGGLAGLAFCVVWNWSGRSLARSDRSGSVRVVLISSAFLCRKRRLARATVHPCWHAMRDRSWDASSVTQRRSFPLPLDGRPRVSARRSSSWARNLCFIRERLTTHGAV